MASRKEQNPDADSQKEREMSSTAAQKAKPPVLSEDQKIREVRRIVTRKLGIPDHELHNGVALRENTTSIFMEAAPEYSNLTSFSPPDKNMNYQELLRALRLT